MLVIDASVALYACSSTEGFSLFGEENLTAPALLRSETRSVLHEQLWRRQLSGQQALLTLAALEDAPIRIQDPPELGRKAWEIADLFGWAKTYDAEYVALAQLLGCRMVTLDQRLRRGAARLGFVILPDEV